MHYMCLNIMFSLLIPVELTSDLFDDVESNPDSPNEESLDGLPETEANEMSANPPINDEIDQPMTNLRIIGKKSNVSKMR